MCKPIIIRESYIYASKKYDREKNDYEFTWYENCDAWVKEYKDYQNKKRKTNPYNDPDSTANMACFNQEFYETLTKFLNLREKERKEKWVFSPPKKPKKEDIPKDRTIYVEEENIFLSSDQFGFSEMKKTCNNPYYSWICKTKIDYTSVAKWLYDTRSLGGSFIWPKEQYKRNLSCHYNNQRGKYPIQDRVDRTLMEIKNYLDCGNREDRHDIYKEKYRDSKSQDNKKYQALFCEISNENTGMKKWLDHFDSFEDYVQFFMFEDFCEEVGTGDNKKYIPKDILTGEIMCDETSKIEELKDTQIEKMMDNLCMYTKNRSRRMKEYLLQ